MPPVKPKNAASFLGKVGSGANTAFVVPPDMVKSERGIYFRSDSRHTSLIFKDGFTPRESGGMIYRTMDQDIAPQSAVCVTKKLDVAVLFPLKLDPTKDKSIANTYKEPPLQTTVYLVAVDKVFNTEDMQARFAARSIRDQGSPQQEKARENLYAQERATDKITADHVIAAVQVIRHWGGSDYTEGGSYQIIGYTLNRLATEKFKDFQGDLQANFGQKTLESFLKASCHLSVSDGSRETWSEEAKKAVDFYAADVMAAYQKEKVAAAASSSRAEDVPALDS